MLGDAAAGRAIRTPAGYAVLRPKWCQAPLCVVVKGRPPPISHPIDSMTEPNCRLRHKSAVRCLAPFRPLIEHRKSQKTSGADRLTQRLVNRRRLGPRVMWSRRKNRSILHRTAITVGSAVIVTISGAHVSALVPLRALTSPLHHVDSRTSFERHVRRSRSTPVPEFGQHHIVHDHVFGVVKAA